MNDIEVSSIDLVEGGNVFKQGHYLTLGYVPRDEKGDTVDLSGKTLNVALWSRKGVAFEAAATFSGGVIRFTLDKVVAAGDYTVEFTATSSTDAKYRKKFPTNQHSGRIAIKQSADDLGVVGIQVYTVAQLKAEQKALLDAAVSGFTVDSETKMARVSDGKTYASLPARLEADKQETTALLAEKLGQGEVSVLDIDKNKGLLDQTYLSQTLLQQIAGTAPVNAVPAPNSITLNQITFTPVLGTIEPNLFNKATAVAGQFLNIGDGTSFVSATYSTSDYIPVVPGTTYYSQSLVRIVYYNASKVHIPDADRSVIAVPAGAAFMRVSVLTSNLDTVQIKTVPLNTPAKINPTTIGNEVLENKHIKAKTIGSEKLSFLTVKGVASKNLFDKLTVLTGQFLNNTTGGVFAAATYSTSDYIPVVFDTPYYGKNLVRVVYYDANKNMITAPDATIINVPSGAVFMRVSVLNTNLDNVQIKTTPIDSTYDDSTPKLDVKSINSRSITEEKLDAAVVEKLNNNGTQRIYTLNDAYAEWLKGSKFPIAFFGDSTFDGSNTTAWTANVIGTDSTNNNAFPKKLEETVRAATNNAVLRIYNAGFAGKTADWGLANASAVLKGTSAYNDTKMVGLGFGINDRLNFANEKAYRDGFKANMKALIDWCYANAIQPFLLTTQAIVEPGVLTTYIGQYPMRTSEAINSVANEVKKELADEYNLELVDLNKLTEMFLIYSSYPTKTIISDRLHFGDVGHKFESEVVFSHIVPMTITADSYTQIDYSSQKIKNSVPEDWLTMPDVPVDSFKVFVDYTKADAADLKIMNAWVFIDSKKKLTLKAYRGTSATAYVKVNGVVTNLVAAETVIGQLEMGLYRLEVFTGASNKADFKGFILE